MNTRTSIGELALRLHRSSETTLRLELGADDFPPDPIAGEDYTLTQREIEFSSIFARNHYAAAFTYSQLDPENGDFARLLFTAAYQLWRTEIANNDKAAGRLVAIASEQLDVISAATRYITEGADLWDTLHILEATIPYLTAINPESLIDLCEIKFDRVQGDLAGGMVHGVIEAWYATRPREAVELRRLALRRVSPASASLLGNALLAIAISDFALATDMVLEDVSSNDLTRSGAGVWTAGRMLLASEAPREQLLKLQDSVLKKMQSSEAGPRVQAIQSAGAAVLVMDTFNASLKELCRSGDQHALVALAHQMSCSSEIFAARPDLSEWLDVLIKLEPPLHRNGSPLDHALAHFVQGGTLQPFVLAFLAKWTEQNGKRVGFDNVVAHSFPLTISTIGIHEPSRRAMVTTWLLADNVGLPASLQHILEKWPKSQVGKLETAQIDKLDHAGLVFLARRILGFLHDRIHMTSIVLSLLEGNESQTRIYPLLNTMLVNEIGYDYPTSTIEACEKAADEMEEHKDMLLKVSANLRESASALAALVRAKELMPPMRLRRLFATARAKQMSEAFKDASKDSIWRTIATHITIKAGRGTFAYRKGAYSEPMQMHTISHEVEVPRREIFDPVGSAIRRLQFRIAKRGEQ